MASALQHDNPHCPGAETRWVSMLALFLLGASIFFFVGMGFVSISATPPLFKEPYEVDWQAREFANAAIIVHAICIVGWLVAGLGAWVTRHTGVLVLSFVAPLFNLAGIYGALAAIETFQRYANQGVC